MTGHPDWSHRVDFVDWQDAVLAGRLLALADEFDDEAADAVLLGKPRRAFYLEWWSGRVRERVQKVAQLPALRAVRRLHLADAVQVSG